jgi:hypothetical protein
MGSEGQTAAERVQILTTMHAALQAARGSTVFEATGRASLFLTTLSGALIALGFIAQVTRLGSAFYFFTDLFLLSLALIGVITFRRLVQTGVEDMVAARGINRIIRSYLKRDPELGSVLLQDPGGGGRTIDDFYGPIVPRRLVFTTASMVGAVTSILLGVVAGLAAAGPAGRSVGVVVGAGVALLSGAVHLRYQGRLWEQWDQRVR